MTIYRLVIKVLLLVFIISLSLPVWGTSNKFDCSQIQRSIMSDIRKYNAEYEIKNDQVFPPGEDFDKLAKDMLDKGIIKVPYRKGYGDCSYGLDYDSLGDLKIYCKYHGDINNAEWLKRVNRVRRNNSLSFGFTVMLGLVFVSFCVSCIKAFFRSSKKKVTDENKTKQIDY